LNQKPKILSNLIAVYVIYDRAFLQVQK